MDAASTLPISDTAHPTGHLQLGGPFLIVLRASYLKHMLPPVSALYLTALYLTALYLTGGEKDRADWKCQELTPR